MLLLPYLSRILDTFLDESSFERDLYLLQIQCQLIAHLMHSIFNSISIQKSISIQNLITEKNNLSGNVNTCRYWRQNDEGQKKCWLIAQTFIRHTHEQII